MAVAVVPLVADFATKEIALAYYSPHDPIELLGGFLRLTLVFNSGAAFSIGTGMTWVFSLIMIGVILYILRISRKLRSVGWAVSLGLILSGATGNFIDRVWRPNTRELSGSLVGPDATGTVWERLLSPPSPLNGHVVDWIQLPYYPVFNIADSAIVCGGILTVILAFRGINIDGTRESHSVPASKRSGAADTVGAAETAKIAKSTTKSVETTDAEAAAPAADPVPEEDRSE